MKKNLEKLFAHKEDSIIDVIEIINTNELKHAFIVDENKRLLGIVNDGDIRRAILKDLPLTIPIKNIMIKNPFVAKVGVSESYILEILLEKKILIIPVLDNKKKVVSYYHIMDFIKEKYLKNNIKRDTKSKKLKKILVTGGAGYIGSILVRLLLKHNYNVRVLDKLSYGINSIEELISNPNFELVQGDFTKIEDWVPNLKDISIIIHLAAIVGDPAGKVNHELTEETNFHGVKILAELCKYYGIQKFIFVSTCSVYGASHNELLNENSKLNPVSLYASTKLKAENILMQLRSETFHPCILRLATVFGLSPRMRFDLVINLLTAYAIKNKEISIFSGDQWRPFIHVEDVAEAILNILNQPNEKISGEIFNISKDENNFQIKEIGKLMKKIFPEIKVNYIESKEDDRSYRVSCKKIKEKLNFNPKYDLMCGIKEIADYLTNNDINVKENRYSNYKHVQFGTFDSIFFIE